jgi:D-alanyl-D-alanine carboxypeptidase
MSSRFALLPGRIRRSVLVVVLAWLVAALVAPVAGAAPPTAAKLRREVNRVVAAGVPWVILLVRDGRRTVRVAGGSARLKPRRAMRVSDRFRIGSLTKTYVATVVLQLAGEGRLSLEDSIERWLPAWCPRDCPTNCV